MLPARGQVDGAGLDAVTVSSGRGLDAGPEAVDAAGRAHRTASTTSTPCSACSGRHPRPARARPTSRPRRRTIRSCRTGWIVRVDPRRRVSACGSWGASQARRRFPPNRRLTSGRRACGSTQRPIDQRGPGGHSLGRAVDPRVELFTPKPPAGSGRSGAVAAVGCVVGGGRRRSTGGDADRSATGPAGCRRTSRRTSAARCMRRRRSQVQQRSTLSRPASAGLEDVERRRRPRPDVRRPASAPRTGIVPEGARCGERSRWRRPGCR